MVVVWFQWKYFCSPHSSGVKVLYTNCDILQIGTVWNLLDFIEFFTVLHNSCFIISLKISWNRLYLEVCCNTIQNEHLFSSCLGENAKGHSSEPKLLGTLAFSSWHFSFFIGHFTRASEGPLLKDANYVVSLRPLKTCNSANCL